MWRLRNTRKSPRRGRGTSGKKGPGNEGQIIVLLGKPLAPDAVLTPEKLGEIYAVAAQKPVEILKTEDYPEVKWEFLLRLVNLFQLSFPLSEDGQRQICPTLLHPPRLERPGNRASRHELPRAHHH